MNLIKKFLQSEDGPTAVEYAVMLALIVVVCIGTISAVGTKDGLPNLDLNLLTASFTAEGDIADELRTDYGISKDFAPGLKLMLIGEGKVALKAGDLLKLTEFMKAKQIGRAHV